MKVLVVIAAVAAYFAVMVAVVPPLYLESYTSYPAPVHSVTVSDDAISLGESFRLRVDVVNDRDFADFVVTSVGFPGLEDAGAHVDLVGYDFDLPPRYVAAGDQPRSIYGAGSDGNAYASIESTGSDVGVGERYHIALSVTPPASGDFAVHVKTAAVPHSHGMAHFPHSGPGDAQGETVEIHVVSVVP